MPKHKHTQTNFYDLEFCKKPVSPQFLSKAISSQKKTNNKQTQTFINSFKFFQQQAAKQKKIQDAEKRAAVELALDGCESFGHKITDRIAAEKHTGIMYDNINRWLAFKKKTADECRRQRLSKK